MAAEGTLRRDYRHLGSGHPINASRITAENSASATAAKLALAVTALEFYADEANYADDAALLIVDDGDTAIAALAAIA